MFDWESAVVRVQVPLRDVGRVGTALRQHVIPRLVARRFRAGDVFVPFVAALKRRIDVEDHTTIAEEIVADHLAYRKLRAGVVAGHLDQFRFEQGAQLIGCSANTDVKRAEFREQGAGRIKPHLMDQLFEHQRIVRMKADTPLPVV
jgi:hypothetical protein